MGSSSGIAALLLSASVLTACSSSSSESEVAQPMAEAGTSEAGGDATSESAQADGPSEVRLSFVQAIHGAMWANPEVYSELPLRIGVVGHPASVTVTLDQTTVEATDADGDGTWMAMMPIAGLAEGIWPVTAKAGTEQCAAELGIGASGVQWTVFSEVGPAGTPKLLRAGDRAWLTWTDSSNGQPEAWLREVDGAGRWAGEQVAIVDDSLAPALYARTALAASAQEGEGRIGVLYQSLGTPYVTHFKIVDLAGHELVASKDLDPDGWSASFGGDIQWDGSAFMIVWRVFEDALPGTSFAHSRLMWARVQEDGTTIGPVVVAESGDGKPVGGFEPFSFVKVASTGTASMVSFVRAYYEPIPDALVPKAQVGLVSAEGVVGASSYLAGGDQDPYGWARDCRVHRLGDGLVAMWTAKDIMEPVDNPRNVIFGMRADAQGVLQGQEPVKMVDHEGDRDEPTLMAHSEHLAVLGWLDARSYEEDPATGRIELYVAPVGQDLIAGEPVTFGHAKFVAGTSELSLSAAGTNALITWVDERHGLGIADPKPEVYFETAWY